MRIHGEMSVSQWSIPTQLNVAQQGQFLKSACF